MSLNLFNAKWYLAQNPDVAADVAAGKFTAEEHFKLHGNAEGRSPGPLFDVAAYLAASPDVKAAVDAGQITAYDHFLQFGALEDRSPLAVFDSAFYLAQNPDVAQAVAAGQTSAVAHFLAFGQGEPRSITPAIDLKSYLEANPDVKAAVDAGQASAFDHMITYGLSEGRKLGNGVDLSLFKDDPAFTAALATGNVDAALVRVDAVAPFIPDFVRPAGWKPAENTPIPTDFKPADGSKLHVPDDIKVPEGQILPDVFDNATPGGGGGGGGGSATFTVEKKVEDGDTIYSFGGTATGDITVAIENNIATFTRGEVTADTTVSLAAADWKAGDTFLSLAAGDTLRLEHAQANAFSAAGQASSSVSHAAIIGTGTVNLVKNLVDADLNLLGISGESGVQFIDTIDNTASSIVVVMSQLSIHPQHADKVTIMGTGKTSVSLQEDVTVPVTLDVRTNGNLNIIGGTAGADTITIVGDSSTTQNSLTPGKGGDKITLGTGNDTVQVRVGKGAFEVSGTAKAATQASGAKAEFADATKITKGTLTFKYNGTEYSATVDETTETDVANVVQTALGNATGGDSVITDGQIKVSLDNQKLVLESVADKTADTLTDVRFAGKETLNGVFEVQSQGNKITFSKEAENKMYTSGSKLSFVFDGDLVTLDVGKVVGSVKQTIEAVLGVAGIADVSVFAVSGGGFFLRDKGDPQKLGVGNSSPSTLEVNATIDGTSAPAVPAQHATVSFDDVKAALSAGDTLEFAFNSENDPSVMYTATLGAVASPSDDAAILKAVQDAVNDAQAASGSGAGMLGSGKLTAKFDGNKLILEAVDATSTVTAGSGGKFTNKDVIASDSYYSANGAETFDVITNFDVAADRLKLGDTSLLDPVTGRPTSADDSFTVAQNGLATFTDTSLTLQAKLDALADYAGSGKGAVAFIDSGNTYVFKADGVSGLQDSDVVIQISGVSVTSLADILAA